MRRSSALVLLALSLGTVRAHAGPTAQQLARRKLVEPTYDPKTLYGKIITRRLDYRGVSGYTIDRHPVRDPAQLTEQYHAQLSRLLELDPQRTLLGKSDWARIEDEMQLTPTYALRNVEEHISVALRDPELQLQQAQHMVEKARGRLAIALSWALRNKKADPEALAAACEKLATKYSFFENPFRVEHFIKDMRGLSPALARWDFSREPADAIVLPRSIQRVVRSLGQRVFKNVNVLFADHLYEDGVIMIDAMRAAGLDPDNARFVTTPYPFDPVVRQKVEARGVKTESAPHSKEQTKVHLERAIRDLLARSHDNHGPILVFDDGGLASEVIAEKFANQLSRFRIVEITKSGERIAKTVLPNAHGIDYRGLLNLTPGEMEKQKQRFLNATSWDGPSRAAAELNWQEIERALPRLSRSTDPWDQNKISPRTHGFAHYTYSDSRYKREVMTPLYTQAVNLATFETIEHGGKTLPNKRVTIIGGGAMGLNAGLELRERGFEVTFVEPDAARRTTLENEHKFATSELKPALKGRGLILELSGLHKLITADHLFLIDDGAFVVHGSSKDNPFDMTTIKALASETIPWKPNPTGQESASYVFEAAGRKRTLHFPGNGFTISHGGKAQNVPLESFLPEVDALLRLGAHAVTQPAKATMFPFFGTPSWLLTPGAQRKVIRSTHLSPEPPAPAR